MTLIQQYFCKHVWKTIGTTELDSQVIITKAGNSYEVEVVVNSAYHQHCLKCGKTKIIEKITRG
jgi:hypothetical protein